MNWNKFYNIYYDCTLEEQIQYSNELSNYGESDEILDVLMGFAASDLEHARIFLSRVIEANVCFTKDQIFECAEFINKDIFSELVASNIVLYDKDELLKIIKYANKDTVSILLSKMNIDYLRDNNYVVDLYKQVVIVDSNLAEKIIHQSLKFKTAFTCNQVIYFIDKINNKALSFMAVHSKKPFNREQIEALYLKINDKAFEHISKRANIDIIKEKQEEQELDEYVKQQVNDILNQVENETTSIFTKILNKLFKKD